MATTAIAYLLALLGMATIGGVVPFVGRIGTDLQASAGGIGLALALFSLPSALLSLAGGMLIDRLGAGRAMRGGAMAIALGDVIAGRAATLAVFDIAMLIAGFGFTFITVGAPALLVNVLADGARIRAMAFWATYAPTGVACGLLLALPFTGVGDWRGVLLANAGIALAVGVAAWRMGESPVRGAAATTVRQFETRRSPSVSLLPAAALRLGLATAVPNFIAYGTSLVAPSYLARLHHVTLGTAVGAVAAAKIAAVLLGGVVTGQVLQRRRAPAGMFVLMAAIGGIAQVALFLPDSSFAVAIAGLMVWLFAFGGMSGVAMALLPAVIASPDRRAATAGLINQCVSVLSFAAPYAYFATGRWAVYLALAGVGLGASAVLVPGLTIADRAANGAAPPETAA